MDRFRGLAGDAKDGGGNGERLILGEFIRIADGVDRVTLNIQFVPWVTMNVAFGQNA